MMREIGVGIRIGEDGISFTGIEVVNGLINRGARVTSIEPGGAIMRKIGEDDNDVSLTLSGCEMKVVVDDAGVEESSQSLEHNRLYQEAVDLVTPYMRLSNQPEKAADSEEANQELKRGIELLHQALAIDPGNWSAHWLIGKSHQSLNQTEEACDAFGKSFGLQKGNADVAREYMFECLKLGRAKDGIRTARHALIVDPDNAGLVSNLALALLIGGELEEATETVEKAMKLDPDDQISRNLEKMIADVLHGRRKQPSKMSDLNSR